MILANTISGHTIADTRNGSRPADPNAPPCAVRILRTDAEFDALEPVWNGLLQKSDASVFQSFEWQRTWWKYFHGDLKLHILLFERDGELVGIAPLCTERKKLLGIPVATRLNFIGVGLSDYLWPIVLKDREETVMASFAAYLASTQQEWDVFDLEDVNESAGCFRLLPECLASSGLPVYRYQGNVCPRIPLPPTSEEFMANLGSTASYNLKRKFKRLRSNFTSETELIRSESDGIENAIDDFSLIHGGRWKSQGHPSAFDDPHHRAFHVEICRKFARRDWLRIFFLKVNGERVAVNFSFNYRATIYMYQSNAHGPEDVMKCSPGLLVRSVAMVEGINEGMRVFDFMRGNEAYKYREWDARDSKNWLLRSSSRTAAGRVRFFLFLWAELISKVLNRLKWEYFEYRRFRISSPDGVSVWGYLWRKSVSLIRIYIRYLARHLPWAGKTPATADEAEGDA